MMRKISLILFVTISFQLSAQEKITFKAADGLEITADKYFTNPANSPLILLFHQAGWSRGEYNEIAPKLNELGYNCIAIDQRSGKEVNDVVNETYKRALEEHKGTTYVDALVDLNSAIDYAKLNYKEAKKLIVWGSSYSAGLVIKIAGDRQDLDGVLAFSPGEYFSKLGKPKDWITQSAKNIKTPVFITSMNTEKKKWLGIAEVIPDDYIAYYLPPKLGKHGSKVLWKNSSTNQMYWKAVKDFLEIL